MIQADISDERDNEVCGVAPRVGSERVFARLPRDETNDAMIGILCSSNQEVLGQLSLGPIDSGRDMATKNPVVVAGPPFLGPIPAEEKQIDTTTKTATVDSIPLAHEDPANLEDQFPTHSTTEDNSGEIDSFTNPGHPPSILTRPPNFDWVYLHGFWTLVPAKFSKELAMQSLTDDEFAQPENMEIWS